MFSHPLIPQPQQGVNSPTRLNLKRTGSIILPSQPLSSLAETTLVGPPLSTPSSPSLPQLSVRGVQSIVLLMTINVTIIHLMNSLSLLRLNLRPTNKSCRRVKSSKLAIFFVHLKHKFIPSPPSQAKRVYS